MDQFLEPVEELTADSGLPYPTLAHMAWADRPCLLQLLILLCRIHTPHEKTISCVLVSVQPGLGFLADKNSS
jgi:hypothetical protein